MLLILFMSNGNYFMVTLDLNTLNLNKSKERKTLKSNQTEEKCSSSSLSSVFESTCFQSHAYKRGGGGGGILHCSHLLLQGDLLNDYTLHTM